MLKFCMSPVTDIDVWDRFLGSFVEVWKAISGCLGAFLFLLLLYTLAVIWLINFLYKHREQNLEYKEDNLRIRTAEIESREKKWNEFERKYNALEKELKSPEYLAYKCNNKKVIGQYTDGSNLFDDVVT